MLHVRRVFDETAIFLLGFQGPKISLVMSGKPNLKLIASHGQI
jgi:hypothetical protein